MAGYTLIGSASIVQVLSPTSIADMVAVTIQTQPTGIIATALVSQADVDAGTAALTLQTFADGIETIIGYGKAVGGTGTSSRDASGLQQYAVTFEVAYNPPGAPAGAVTVDVAVPVLLLTTPTTPTPPYTFASAEALIDQAYNNLVALSGNPSPSDGTAGGSLAPPTSSPVTP